MAAEILFLIETLEEAGNADVPISQADLYAITDGWDTNNKRRHRLIEKKHAQTLRPEEAEELKNLQRLAGLKRELLSSPKLNELVSLQGDSRKDIL